VAKTPVRDRRQFARSPQDPGRDRDPHLQTVKFVLNTHWHFDHTAQRELGKAGAIIVAHENVRKRLSTEGSSSFWHEDQAERKSRCRS